MVSIHAPREGCDFFTGTVEDGIYSFNSRTPGGVRRNREGLQLPSLSFNSRTPGGVRLV